MIKLGIKISVNPKKMEAIMLKQTTISLLLMQILLAAGADYTLPEVEKKLNELQIIPLAIPDGIPNPTKIHYTPMPEQICRKCGKKYQLSSEYQSIMASTLNLEFTCD